MSPELVYKVLPIIGSSGIKSFLKMREFTDYLEQNVNNPAESLEMCFLLKFVEADNDIKIMHHLDHVFIRLLNREIGRGKEEAMATDIYTLSLQRLDEFFWTYYTNIRESM